MEFLVSKIAEQARREGVPLSEVERKMLYFSETAWTLPDIVEVNETFDREYDPVEYEQKISKLVRNFCDKARAADREDLASWNKAVSTIRRDDRYLLILIDGAKDVL